MKSILIVEDEPLIALDLQHACEDAGRAAIVVTSSRQAMEAIAEGTIDGAVLDAHLGRGETCEAIAEVLRERGIPFVLNTGNLGRAEEYLRGIDAPVIRKPNAAQAVVAQLLELSSRTA